MIAITALAFFLYGFFPLKYNDRAVAGIVDIPDHVEHARVKKNELYKPTVEKIIIMVIDALRWDFVTKPENISAMPVTSRLIKQNFTCLMQAKSDPPTVTMPRIKAMMTGGVSSFIDVALNFGDLPVREDSLLLQAKNHGHVIHFYGDDTWLKIFPDMFERYEGTTSFYVNDFTEVDDNVTRHVEEELEKKDDWSILILHYLGLDHIGHVAGPFSPLIEQKLGEMDRTIDKIEKKIQSWKENGLSAIFVICGDHGMKDSGGHGGSTPQETLVPFFVVGANCPSNIKEPNRISQIDIAPSFSMMLGTPIPSSNVGSIPSFMMDGRTESSKLFVLYYNAQQVLKHFKMIPNYETSTAWKYYNDAVKLHVNWLNNKEESTAVEEALVLYDKALQLMKELLIHNTIDYDLHAMAIAMILMVQILCILANGDTCESRENMRKCFCIICSVMSYFTLRFIFASKNTTSFKSESSVLLNIIAIGILVSNSFVIGNMSFSKLSIKRFWNLEFQDFLYPLALFTHVASLSSSSFVEEEHQTWYFFWGTILIILCFDVVQKWRWRNGIELLASLVLHRILRKLNSTGNRYANAPDIEDWLRNDERHAAMTIILLIALGLLLWIGYIFEEKKYKIKTFLFHTGAAICIYFRQMAIGNVAKIAFHFNSRGIIEVRVFWIIIIFYSLHWIYRLCCSKDKKHFSELFLRFIIQIWIIISSILHRPHNVILLPAQVLVTCAIHKTLRRSESENNSILYTHIWIGNIFYFYQGNSNSLATIDVAAGYVGMESYRLFVATIFLCINTYSAPVLAYLTVIYRSILCETSDSYFDEIFWINRNYALWRFLPLVVYTFVVTIERYHLFIWTVFSPKLLYESMYCTVIFIFISTIQIIFFFLRKK